MTHTVVLIDDDRACLASLEALFATADYDVRAFRSAAAFLEEIENIPLACIVTDLRMPNMGGLALIKRLKTGLRPDWPVVVISGNADIAEAVEAMQAGALDLLVKPVSQFKLLEIVSHAIRMRDQTTANVASDSTRR